MIANRVFLFLALFLPLGIVLHGCDRGAGYGDASKKPSISTLFKKEPGPKEVLSEYLDASLHGLHAESYKYISAKDKAIKTRTYRKPRYI